jgi:hypothetical protein
MWRLSHQLLEILGSGGAQQAYFFLFTQWVLLLLLLLLLLLSLPIHLGCLHQYWMWWKWRKDQGVPFYCDNW